jgi:hypothetical protein
MLAPRPDPRRTRQLMRQNILASKSRAAVLEPLPDEEAAELGSEELNGRRASGSLRQRSRRLERPAPSYTPERYREFEEEQIANDWIQHGESTPEYLDPDLGIDEDEDPLEERVRRASAPRLRAPSTHLGDKLQPEVSDDELLEAELEEKRRKSTRRKLLLTALGIGGTAVAAYEIIPRIPGAVGQGASDLGSQLQQAFNNGVTQGGNAARKDLLNALDDLEGFSLESAIEAAKLTRVAYDVFVSPLVTLSSEVVGDFLTVTLDALIKGRQWLAQINEDNATLAALQNVLTSWVQTANEMPKQIQTITDTDLDGAQAYLRALQQEIQTQQAQLNAQTTATPTGKTTTTPTATP